MWSSEPQRTPKPEWRPKTTWLPRQYRKATAKDLEGLSVSGTWFTRDWDPDDIPVFVGSSIFDSYSFTQWLTDHIKERDHVQTTPQDLTENQLHGMVDDLSTRLRVLTLRLKRIRTEKVNFPTERGLLDKLERKGYLVWHCLRNLVKKCEKYMWKDSEGSSLRKDAGQWFVTAMFGARHELRDTLLLTKKLQRWMDGWYERGEKVLDE